MHDWPGGLSCSTFRDIVKTLLLSLAAFLLLSQRESALPEPLTLVLAGCALLGLAGILRRLTSRRSASLREEAALFAHAPLSSRHAHPRKRAIPA